MKLPNAALEFATKKHEGQFYLPEMPYVEHCKRVALQFESEHCQIVALLHDVLEDTDCTAGEIGDAFGWSVRNRVQILTRQKREKYSAYLTRVIRDTIACEIKRADIFDNLSNCIINLERYPEDERDWLLMAKRYARAAQFLIENADAP